MKVRIISQFEISIKANNRSFKETRSQINEKCTNEYKYADDNIRNFLLIIYLLFSQNKTYSSISSMRKNIQGSSKP